ncbi:carboxy-S-adenosyl-L-methionine synthase CmoA [Glaciecola siphonariae]|uniref:Carboxy-S-adenosyl-L-methionine synthase n=1 Tax=Glaciecola siphonariae TaxID=521012 RepID=A0ABV9LS21_9ALTE
MSNKTEKNKVDRLFKESKQDLFPFKFNQSVVDVFPDMINRSVPGYTTIVDGIGRVSRRFTDTSSRVYDLGCSLGNVSLSIAKYNVGKALTIEAIDNSPAMVTRCKEHVGAYNYDAFIQVQHADITALEFQACSLVVINFTLQFINPSLRQAIIDKIYASLEPGGALILSEKISASSDSMDSLLIDLHHEFKRENGYSDLEISQKRTALENVMILDTLKQHKQRLEQAGFEHPSVWFQHFNFMSLIAIKQDIANDLLNAPQLTES